MKILIVGGDQRNRHLFEELRGDGFDVAAVALDEGSVTIPDCGGFDVVIGPVPFSRDGVALYAPLYPSRLAIDDFLAKLPPSASLFAGTIPADRAANCRYIDLTKDSGLYERNLVPTCEGIVQLILNGIDFTVAGAKILVAGYGKVGRALVALLGKLDAELAVYSADETERAALHARGMLALLDDLTPYDIVVNTIPAVVFTGERLRTLRQGTLLIDVASAPGGVDPQAAESLGIRLVVAPGLPGRKAPRTVARAMKEVILRVLDQR